MFRFSTCSFRGVALAIILNIGLVVCSGGTVRAEDQDGGVPGDWLSTYLGARTAGIGGAFVAAAAEPISVVWNPAGLSLLSQNQVYVETARLFESTSINGVSFAFPARRFPSFGLTILNLRSGEFERTNELNESMGEFSEGDIAFVLSACKSVNRRFSLGANVKVVRQSIEEFDAAGVGFDLGLLYNITRSLRFGASVLNVGGPTLTLRAIDESYPAEFRGGFSFEFFSGRALITGEINHRSGPGASFHGGTEFWVHRNMALRFGYTESSPSGGFSYRIMPGMRFDYAATDHELGVTHRFGMSYQFGGFFASSEAVPPIFSPLGQQSVTKFYLKAKTKADAERWSLDIEDKSGHIVRRFGGKGTPPAHVMWDGKDESGLSLPDGIYKYRLVVIDLEGREFVGHERKVEITTEGPRGAVPVFTKDD
ncbi:MAG: PorV/PorQ family protein [Candidatus Latescibacteria bacterium]|nr:PorV/PorQ family protein [Candidatus Latescibacterota bacterium]NIO56186.1 PorV/PorQ family protein [Candidatus Latescibacterota bacterium]